MTERSVADVLMSGARDRAKPSVAAAAKGGRKPASSGNKDDKGKDVAKGLAESEIFLSVQDSMDELLKKQPDFDPRRAALWKDGEQVPFIFLARALDLIANESGRLAITEILCNVFRTVIAVTPVDLLPVVYLSANKVAPAHEGVELGIGDAAIIRALAEAFGRKEDQVKSQMKVLFHLSDSIEKWTK